MKKITRSSEVHGWEVNGCLRSISFAALVSSLTLVPAGLGAVSTSRDQQPVATTGTTDHGDREDLTDALDEVTSSTAVVRKMKADSELPGLLKRAKGIFLVPNYGRAAAIVGGAGGEGVLLAHRADGTWSEPVFYNIGSISVGAQAGVDAGQIAMVLMTDRALNSFKGNNTFSLNADAGLTIVDYSARGRASVGIGDVILWSDTEGAFVGASLGASSISADEDANAAYYGSENVPPAAILAGTVTKSRPAGNTLAQALAK